MKTNISFIVPCYNCAETITETLVSIIDTNCKRGDEIILIDDASTDDTLTRLLEFKSNHSFIKVQKHNYNKGTAAAARNTGIDHAQHDLLFCLDSDNILKPHSIAPLLDFLLMHSLDAAAFGKIEYFSDHTMDTSFEWNLHEKLNFIEALNDPMKTPCGSGNYLYTRAIWQKAGRYNESVGGAYDSEIFGLRLLGEGAKFWTLPGYSYMHRTGYESTFIKEYNKRNRSLLFLSGIIDYLHLIDNEDVEYMFGRAKYSWMDDIEQRPLRPRKPEKKSLVHRIERKLRQGLKL